MTDNQKEDFNEGELSDDALENVSGGFDAKTLISAAKVITAKGAGTAKAKIDSNRCIYCGTCVSVCPINAIDQNNYSVGSSCMCCGACQANCPAGAISF